MEFKLKTPPAKLPPLPLTCTSSTLHPSPTPTNISPRTHYLAHPFSVPPPLISASSFVPASMVTHLMRRKKNSALGVKFVKQSKFAPDEITNMEGALHTFITPVISRCEIVGDYRYSAGHGITRFGVASGNQITRSVVMSGAIQMDFETGDVALAFCKVGFEEVVGKDLGVWEILGVQEKQDANQRKQYDQELRKHMVFHLTVSHGLPPRSRISKLQTLDEAISNFEALILAPEPIADKLVNTFAETENHERISLELLYNTAIHMLRNEVSALEALCEQGYIYTYDPASIFAAKVNPTFLNRLMLAALRTLSEHNTFTRMKAFGFNHYADAKAIKLTRSALKKQEHVMVVSKDELFKGPEGIYDVEKFGEEIKGSLLVIHNNSDGFGQNIESEWSSGSLDGAIGANSSAAASLKRDREDLTSFVF